MDYDRSDFDQNQINDWILMQRQVIVSKKCTVPNQIELL